MAGLLEELEKKKKTTLSRGTSIVTESTVTKEAVLSKPANSNIHTELIDTTQIPANIRVNQGIRNTINALEIIGYGESQKEVVENLLTTVIASLSVSEQKKIQDLNRIYDEKDKKALVRKQKKK